MMSTPTGVNVLHEGIVFAAPPPPWMLHLHRLTAHLIDMRVVEGSNNKVLDVMLEG